MRKIKYFLAGFRNAFISDIDTIKKEYPVYGLWGKSREIENKFKAINEKTQENINKHIYPTTY
jgi:hypothetical protein